MPVNGAGGPAYMVQKQTNFCWGKDCGSAVESCKQLKQLFQYNKGMRNLHPLLGSLSGSNDVFNQHLACAHSVVRCH